MRTLAIGDIHGCSVAFDTLLQQVAPQPDDLLITLGDYVDRGPDSRGVLDRLCRLRRHHRLVALRGNHDQMMVEVRNGWLPESEWRLCGGGTTLLSYGSLDDVPDAHWQFLQQHCVNYHETDRHFFVHATVEPDLPLAAQAEWLLLWEKLSDPRPHVSGKVMVCGHTRQPSGLPLNLGHTICIDTWVYGPGWLTCLEIESGRIWQANQRGEQRQFQLDGSSPRA
jgi:serine/threonine protein phosphatase 1